MKNEISNQNNLLGLRKDWKQLEKTIFRTGIQKWKVMTVCPRHRYQLKPGDPGMCFHLLISGLSYEYQRKYTRKVKKITSCLPHMDCDSFRIVDTILFLFCFETIQVHFIFSFWVNHIGEIDTILVRTAAQLARRMFCLNWIQVDD